MTVIGSRNQNGVHKAEVYTSPSSSPPSLSVLVGLWVGGTLNGPILSTTFNDRKSDRKNDVIIFQLLFGLNSHTAPAQIIIIIS